jgi:prepilin-type N-terminal cleavage/methylation domain-containing protein
MTTTRNRQPSRRAFSLIELMIVILIIAMIIAIVVPALGHARKAGRNSATQQLMVQVEQACTSFQISERRLPGYFSARDMGSTTNAGIGFTAMENVMFELAGGIVPANSPNAFQYGPTPTSQVWYDGDKVGILQGGNKAYFTPPAKYFKRQDGTEGLGTKVVGGNNYNYIRDLVDAEGTPILLWIADPMSVQPVTTANDFALKDSPATANILPARYYWNANAAFLNSTTCGDKRVDQVSNSLIGGGGATAIASMLGVLGNPSSPNNLTPPAGQPILPTAGRGAFILQAAGSNGVFVGKEERGGKTATGGNTLGYDLNFRSQPASDLMKDFDDILVAGGG